MDMIDEQMTKNAAFLRLVAEREAEKARFRRDEMVAHFGTIVQMYREDLEMSQRDLAAASGVKLDYIRLLEGKLLKFSELTLELLEALALALRLSALILLVSGGFHIDELPRDTDDAPWRCRRSDN